MDYRTFWLKNSKNQIFNLSSDVGFIKEPSNLGFNKSLNSIRLGDRSLVIDELLDLLPVSGDIVFYGDTNSEVYQKYFNFIQFIKFKPLTLYYQTPNIKSEEDAYHALVSVTQLDKAEINYNDNFLTCPVSFQMLHHWESKKIFVDSSSSTRSGKKYPNHHPYSYGSDGLTGIYLKNDGTEDVGMIININGVCTNPKLVLSEVGGKQYGICQLLGTFGTVMINSIDTEESIVLTQNGVPMTNPLNYQDLSVGSPAKINITFMKLKVGTSRLSFTCDNNYTSNVTVEYTPAYASV